MNTMKVVHLLFTENALKVYCMGKKFNSSEVFTITNTDSLCLESTGQEFITLIGQVCS